MAFPSVVAADTAFGSLLLHAANAIKAAKANNTFFILILFVFVFKLVYESFVSFYAQNGQTSILASLCQSEEHRPKDAFCRYADR
jgi:hypothetical protein